MAAVGACWLDRLGEEAMGERMVAATGAVWQRDLERTGPSREELNEGFVLDMRRFAAASTEAW